MYIFNMRGPVLELTILTRRVPLVKLELPTLPERLNSPRVLVGFVLLDLVCPFLLFLLVIVLSVLLRYIRILITPSNAWYLQTLLIYSRLIKYTQHTAGFTENSIGPRTSQGRTLLLNI